MAVAQRDANRVPTLIGVSSADGVTPTLGEIDPSTGELLVKPSLPSGAATSANQTTMITNLQTLNSLIPAVYDYISLAYTGSNLTTVIFKTGGSGGTAVSTLTLAYTGSDLISVTKS